MTTADADRLLAAALAHPLEHTPRNMLADELRDAGRWDRATVLGYVLAHRGNDAPRLLFADWCDEQGDRDRAEFVRVQCALARGTRCAKPRYRDVHEDWAGLVPVDRVYLGGCGRCAACDELCALLLRESQLLAAVFGYGSVLYDGRITATPARGFAAEVTTPADCWLEKGDAILAEHPLERVRLTTAPGRHEVTHRQVGLRHHQYTVAGRERWFDEPSCEAVGDGSIVLGLFSMTWPGVAFELLVPDYSIPGGVTLPPPTAGWGSSAAPDVVANLRAVRERLARGSFGRPLPPPG